MKNYESKNLRNVAVLGHGGSGKTIFTEAMAYRTKLIDRMGKVEDRSTISDYDAEEQARSISINTSLIPLEYAGVKINLLDTPGYFDFIGEQQCALRVADAAIILVDATSGVEVGVEKAWEAISEAKIPAMFVINKLDRENVEFGKAAESIKELIGTKAAFFNMPVNEGVGFNKLYDIVGDKTYEYDKGNAKEIETPDDIKAKAEEYKENLMETAASASEELMEKYLEGEQLTAKEINSAIKEAVLSGEMAPIISISALNAIGIDSVLDVIVHNLPSPLESGRNETINNNTAGAFIFKTIVDPYVGRLSLFKVISGKITAGIEMYNLDNDKKEKINHVYTLIGKKQVEVPALEAGDIGAFSKLSDTLTNNILSAAKDPVAYDKIVFANPNIFMGISPKSKGDEDKLGNGIARIREEDMTVHFERNAETSQNLIYGIGEMHIEIIASKLKTRYGVDVELDTPIIPYRETIKKKSVAEGKHKKQSGGSGQFGVVNIEFEPTFDLNVPLEFVDKVVGGNVPRQYIPAVEKGLRKAIEKGVLAEYPMVGLRATLFDGKYHPVDSDEMSFMTAASLAYKEGIPKASPVLLEPIYKVSITVPDKYMGDIMGDLSKKRGRIMGMEPIKGGYQVINAEAPLAEMFKYATELRSMTQARGSFTMEFERYEEVPSENATKIIEDAKARKEASGK